MAAIPRCGAPHSKTAIFPGRHCRVARCVWAAHIGRPEGCIMKEKSILEMLTDLDELLPAYDVLVRSRRGRHRIVKVRL